MPYTTFCAAFNSPTFRVQTIITVLINFGVNFGIEWATLSQWGKLDQKDFPGLWVIKWSPTANSCIALDLLLTAFCVAFFMSVLGSGSVVEEIRKGHCLSVESKVMTTGLWRFTPVRIRHLGLRSLLLGLGSLVVFGLPTLGIVAAALAGGQMDGVAYCAFKGVWAMSIAIPLFVIVWFAAADSEVSGAYEYERMLGAEAATGPAPAMVGNPTPV